MVQCDMPFLDTDADRAYYRHWAAEQPRAAVVFLHGYGEHTGLYHRFAFTLNAAGIDMWAVDQFGHGLSPGTRGDFRDIAASSDLADRLTSLVRNETPDVPVLLQGHSFGAVVTLSVLLQRPDDYVAAVISGAPLVPVPGLLDQDSSFDIEAEWLSADPFYLDAMENDPLAFTDADSTALTRALDSAWDRFGAELPQLRVPTLAVHGTADPIASFGAVEAYAEQLDALTLAPFTGARHDILNEAIHRQVAATIIDFYDQHLPAR